MATTQEPGYVDQWNLDPVGHVVRNETLIHL